MPPTKKRSETIQNHCRSRHPRHPQQRHQKQLSTSRHHDTAEADTLSTLRKNPAYSQKHSLSHITEADAMFFFRDPPDAQTLIAQVRSYIAAALKVSGSTSANLYENHRPRGFCAALYLKLRMQELTYDERLEKANVYRELALDLNKRSL
ncbi:MAG: hypothetical protein BYD32DRAFT_433304 [Podila humilis]|nr:MAG: hypothetical protein BYD32DRAFT_433304 [Podila humilis]